MEPSANELLREVAKALFEMELAKDVAILPGRRLMISPITGIFLETVVSVLVNRVNGNHTNARRLIANIIQELHDRGQGDSKDRSRNTSTLVIQIIGKFVSLCWNADWRRKVAGCEGIALMISDEINLGSQWPYSKEIELCRSIIMVLKDMPPDPPAEVPEVKDTLLRLIRFCNSPRTGNDMAVDMEPLDEAAKKEMTTDEIVQYEWMIKPPAKKCEIYLNLFYMDLTSSNKTVRETCQGCLELMAQLADMKLSDFVKPMVDKLVSNIFTKPLRMFLPLIQIGYMEAMTYLLNMDPPVVEVSDELWRLLNEVIGLGEAEDPPPHPMSPLQRLPRRIALLSAKTKAASIRLITASLVVADYFSKQPVIRQRYVISEWSI
jgi:transformation/transcription domain-associated protein